MSNAAAHGQSVTRTQFMHDVAFVRSFCTFMSYTFPVLKYCTFGNTGFQVAIYYVVPGLWREKVNY